MKLPKILPEQQQEAPNKNLALAIFLLREFCSFPFPRVREGGGNAGRASFQALAGISVLGCGETASLSPSEWFHTSSSRAGWGSGAAPDPQEFIRKK